MEKETGGVIAEKSKFLRLGLFLKSGRVSNFGLPSIFGTRFYHWDFFPIWEKFPRRERLLSLGLDSQFGKNAEIFDTSLIYAIGVI